MNDQNSNTHHLSNYSLNRRLEDAINHLLFRSPMTLTPNLRFFICQPLPIVYLLYIADLCNSLSAGVFLGTCYVQLIPYVQTKFRALFAAADLRLELCDVTAQCVIMAGFFMILVVEMLVHACHGHGNKGDKGK